MLNKHLKRYRGSVIASVLLVTCTVVAMLIQPQLLSNILNKGIVDPTSQASEYAKGEVKDFVKEYMKSPSVSKELGQASQIAYDKTYEKTKDPVQAKKAAEDAGIKAAKKIQKSEAFEKATQKAYTDAQESYLKDHENDRLTIIQRNGLILVIFAFIGLVAGIINTYISARVAQGIGANIRSEAFEKVQKFSLADIGKFSTSGISVRLTNDIVQVQNLIMMTMQNIVRVPLILGFSFIMAITLVPQYWWLFFVFTISIFVILVLAMVIMIPNFSKIQDGLEYVNRIVKENFTGIRVVKSFVQEEKEIEKLTKASTDLTNYTIRVGYVFSIVIPMFFLAANIVSVGIFYFAVDILKSDISQAGNIMSVITYLFMIMFSLIIGAMLIMTISRSAVSIQRLSQIIEHEPSLSFKSEEEGITEFDGTVTFENVSFSYMQAIGDSLEEAAHKRNEAQRNRKRRGNKDVPLPEEKDIPENDLKDISFHVSAGQRIGIVGGTGSGKTTLVSLIARLYDASEGTIRIGGHDIRTISKEALHEDIAIVMQKALLFSGDIEMNLRHGKKDATYEEMERSTRIAQAKEFIDQLERGFSSTVYERGNNFSGGQKQRLSMSRGFIKDPKILILDDSTSALDARSEKLVQQAISKDLKEMTVFIVAQKISSVVAADQIIVMSKGRVVGIGTHKELLKTCPEYVEIYETQKGQHVDLEEDSKNSNVLQERIIDTVEYMNASKDVLGGE